MLEDFHFLRPLWLLALIPLLALAWWWLRRTRSGSGWETAVDSELLAVLLDAEPGGTARWLGRLLLAALIAGCVGLAGPVWEKLPQNVEQKQDALVILLDLSLSMLAEDVKPSRIERARQKITDVLRTREEGQTAIIAYAGDAHTVVPLTDDTATISNLLGALSPEMMPVFGSNPDHALNLAHELFENAKLLQGRILMVTDGIDAINTVSKHRNPAFPISILGIGTYDGGPIPLDKVRQPGRFLRTQEGNQIIAVLDVDRLQDVANLTYGNYATAALGDADLNLVLSTLLPGEDETIEVEREFDTWSDQGYWAVVLLVPLLLIAFRKGVLIALLMALTLPAPPAHANTLTDLWDSLWQRSDQRGVQALRYGEPEKAAALFDDPQWRGVADYRSGNFAQSLGAFTEDNSVTGQYNQGNALARLSEYEAAIAKYDQVLSAQPDHEDAAFNKALVERLLQQQQDAAEQQQDQQDQANNENSESDQDDQNQQQDQSDQEQQSDEEGEAEQNEDERSEDSEQQQGEQQQAEAEQDDSARDEKQEALEQWLRRVPDDPGGLLRRKFSHETKQRLRRGDYSNRQGDKLW